MFYKLLEENILTYGLYVTSAEYSLIDELKDEYDLPTDGWYWFDSLEEAESFFNIIHPEE